jgi:hypothetical protein
MWPDRQLHGLGGRVFAGPQFMSQQGLLIVEFEFVDEHARLVALFLRTFEGFTGRP